MVDKKLVIISGASRGIGKTFLDQYKTQEQVTPIGLNKTGSAGKKIDLMDAKATYELVSQLNLDGVSRIIYMHAIGIDKFEPNGKPHVDYDNDGIDDEVLSSNLTTFLHLAEPLIVRARRTKLPITMCNIGSISDIFEVPYWQSFTRAKNKVRQFCKSVSSNNVRSLFLNVSSTLDVEGNTYGRVKANTTYWLTTKELLEKSFNILDKFHKVDSHYAEFDFFKHNPFFKEDYFTNLPRLYSTWKRDLDCEGKQIPQGIRI